MRIGSLALLAGLATSADAQGTRPDTAPPPTLGAVVIIAERSATPMNQSTAAVTRLTAGDLSRLPYTTVADVLARVPGFAVVDFDGLGRDPQLMVRGFYGGGEADYVQVMVDGRPVLVLSGRVHAYEGYTHREVTILLRATFQVGLLTVALTNAAGGLNPAFEPGDLMLITDHINFSGTNPLIGEMSDARFVGMSEAYDASLRRSATRPLRWLMTSSAIPSKISTPMPPPLRQP